jgi:transposase-like protein|tara:strand:+ start:64 stop:342 length:279 start_codon:yes stop_codon:yes gene_type:complete
MPRKKRSVEEIISKLREAEVALAQGETLAQACRRIGVSDHTFYRWRREYGGLKVDQAKRLREMESENSRLRRAVAELTVDNQILKEAARGNF